MKRVLFGVLVLFGCESAVVPPRAPASRRARPVVQRPARVEVAAVPAAAEPELAEGSACQLLGEIEGEPTTLAADGDAFYVGSRTFEGARIVRIRRQDYQQKKLVDLAEAPQWLASDGRALYWTSRSGALLSLPTGGGVARTLTAHLRGPSGLALDAAHVFISVVGDGAILRFAKSGGGVTQVATRQDRPRAVFAHGRWLFWGTADHRVHSAERDGSGARQHPGGGCPIHFAAEGGSLFWIAIASCTDAAPPIAGSIVRGELGDPSQNATLVPGLHGPLRVATTFSHLYWTSDVGGELGGVSRLAPEAGPTALAPECFGGTPVDVRADDGAGLLVLTFDRGAAGDRGRLVRLPL
jgi:hypothetical protein